MRSIIAIIKPQFINTILSNYTRHASYSKELSKLAKSNNYSVAFLSKTFKQDMGMGFKKYLDTVRLKQSEILLVRTDKKIIEISDSVGFPDVNRFYKLFKERYNATPKQYRLKFKNNSCD